MILPPQITFRNVGAEPWMEERIREEVAGLNRFYERITSCRVMVEALERRHLHGHFYHLRVELGVPGGEVVAENEPGLHSGMQRIEADRNRKQLEVEARYRDLEVAIRDTFKSARRRLQDYARRQRGDVKRHEAPLAEVIELHPREGYGFLRTREGRQLYFHRNSVLGGEFDQLHVGTRVGFSEEPGEKGPQASTVRLAA